MHNKLGHFFCCIFLILAVCNCASDRNKNRQAIFHNWLESNNKIKVLCTTAMIDDLVKQIGAEYVDSIVLIEGELDPHSYQLVKGDDEKLSFAQLIFYNGLELEHGPSLHRYLMQNSKAVSLGDHIHEAHPTQLIEIQGQKDPHVWMDISLWSKTIPFIVKALSQHDPMHKEIFKTNGSILQKKMDDAHAQVHQIMQKVPSHKRFLVTSHDAFRYFTRAYLSEKDEEHTGEWEKRFVAPEGLAPESQLSASNIKAIIDHLRDYQIHLLFPESNVSKDSIKKIVDAAGSYGLDVKIACCSLYADAMGPPGSEGDSYLRMLLYNAKTLSSHMEPELGAEK